MRVELPLAQGRLREVQLRMLEMLDVVVDICQKNGIRYWLTEGTLLGAVRHGGFIPWDDDIDIFVWHEDWDKFQSVCIQSLPDNLSLQNEKTEPASGMGQGICKIRDNRSLYFQNYESFRNQYNRGIFIDVFKCVEYPALPKSAVNYLAKRISFAYGFFHFQPLLNFKNIISYFAYPLSYVFHKGLFEFFKWFGTAYYGPTPERTTYGFSAKKGQLFPLKPIEFEGKMYMGPADPEGYLTNEYGDFMKLPAPEKRRLHLLFAVLDKSECEPEYK
ncbi:MAG: LicD family protein [Bacteroidales bacterium]|nr:LicD family protein [Bacteroidales bacterium]